MSLIEELRRLSTTSRFPRREPQRCGRHLRFRGQQQAGQNPWASACPLCQFLAEAYPSLKPDASRSRALSERQVQSGAPLAVVWDQGGLEKEGRAKRKISLFKIA